MRPLRTTVRKTKTGGVMTYGLYDRVLTKVLDRLCSYLETRHERLWEKHNA